jgi:hypothetical protein
VYSTIQLHAQLDFGTEEVEYEAVQRMLTPELDTVYHDLPCSPAFRAVSRGDAEGAEN